MSPPRVSLRWLLAAVAVLASLVFVVSVGSFGRLMQISTEARLDRGRDTLQRELARIASDADPIASAARPTVLGLHGGIVDGRRADGPSPTVRTATSREIDRAVATLVEVAPQDRAELASLDADGGTVFAGARRRADGRVVWAVYTVNAPKLLGTWQATVTVLTVATVLLGLLALSAVVGSTRGARSLTRSLAALQRDLSADVPRPALAELALVADGVASLARGLADAEREREALADELGRQERLAALGRVVAGVAHEVRNPLASMKLRVAVARDAGRVPEEVVTELDAIDEEIVRLDRLVNDFLVVSGRRLGRRVEVDLGELARKRVAQLAPWASERGVPISAEGSARAVVDPDAYARAVDNLVKNAVEASPAGEAVRVRVERRTGVAALTVEDRGPGVPEQRVHELFEPFFTTKPDGTGLGLAVSRAIAFASGGELSHRREGGVTRFELSLSIAPGAP